MRRLGLVALLLWFPMATACKELRDPQKEAPNYAFLAKLSRRDLFRSVLDEKVNFSIGAIPLEFENRNNYGDLGRYLFEKEKMISLLENKNVLTISGAFEVEKENILHAPVNAEGFDVVTVTHEGFIYAISYRCVPACKVRGLSIQQVWWK